MKNVKKQSLSKIENNNAYGITLIALVITIVLLIILAGVVINLTLGENGIFNKAKQAKENYKYATNEEQSELVNVELTMNEIVEGTINGATGGTTTPIVYAPYDIPYIPTGFTHIGAEDWNSGYRISDTGDETGNIFVWVPCVLDQSKVKVGDKVETFKKTTTEKYNSGLGLLPTDTSVTDVEPTNAIKTSVGTYGGFYIAAYEAGIVGTTANNSLSTKTATDGSVKPLSKSGCGVWNSIKREDALKVAAGMINTTDGVKSGLISGECWDTTLQWMVKSSTNATANVGYDTDSTGKGWYGSTSTILTTGYYGINNIYDMAGNVWEWTAENCTLSGNSYLVSRGGNYGNSGSDHPAAYRDNRNEYAGNGIAFRVVLYK